MEFEQINFVAGSRGAIVEDFYNKLEWLNVQAGEKDKILAAHVQRICKAQDTVMRSYYQQIHGLSGADATTSMENIGEHVCGQITHNPYVISYWRKVKMGQGLSKMSKPTVWHTEGTTQIAELLSISDTTKKLYSA